MTTIGVLASSSSISSGALVDGIAYWEKKGYDVRLSPHVYAQERFLAGSDEERLDDLHAFFKDDEIDIIIEAGGGYGSARLLRKIDYDLIARHKKPLIGLSDTTALQLALLAKSNLISFSGYLMKKRFNRAIVPYTEQSLFDCLNANEQTVPCLETEYLGKPVEGRLVGGCLSLVVSVVGTPYFPQMEGAILILEDLCEEPYVIDRMLSQLENAGVFNQVAAVVFGAFLDCKAKDPADGTTEDVLNEWKDRIKAPVFFGLPYGHQEGSLVFPVGGKGILDSGRLIIKGVDF